MGDADRGQQKRKREESSGDPSLIPSDDSEVILVSLDDVLGARSPRPEASNSDEITKMALVHEIALNKDFKLEEKKLEEGSLEDRVTKVVHSVFWDTLQESLAKDPPDYQQLLQLFADLKEGLFELLLPHQAKLKSEIDEMIDIDFLKQRLENGVTELRPMSDGVVELMGRLCAPARDDDVRKLRETQDLLPRLRLTMETLLVMKRDMANFAIASVRPMVEEHAVTYEKDKFAAFLQTNSIAGLPLTHEWLQEAYEAWETTGPAAKAGTSSAKNSIASIAAEAFVRLLDWPDNRPYPETLLVDQARLVIFRDELLQLTVLASVVLIAANVAPSARSPETKAALKAKLVPLLKDVRQRTLSGKLPTIAETTLETLALGDDEDAIGALRSAVLQLLQPQQAVRKLLRGRVLGLAKALLLRQSGVGEDGGGLEFPGGAALVQTELVTLLRNFLRFAAHNRAVHSERYDQIIATFLPAEKAS